jgi:mannose-1-phosphate guanylyltransferase
LELSLNKRLEVFRRRDSMAKTKDFALIMAGGKGERFWPLSTDERPKQFLNLFSDKTMIQLTVERLEGLVPINHTFVVTGEQYVEITCEQLERLPRGNIIVEPIGRNTAPAIALSAFYIKKHFGSANLVVLPADHLVKDVEGFRMALKNALDFIKKNKDAVVTLGMKPDRPETGYGYIRFVKETGDVKYNETVLKVERFVEKPAYEVALKYLEEGNYLWNAGIFIWNVDTIIETTRRFLPKTYEILNKLFGLSEDSYEQTLKELYPQVDNISVDYGIMEHYDRIYVIPSEFGWDDVGSWTSVERHSEKDEMGNVLASNVYYFRSKGNIVKTNKKTILKDVEDLIVIETDEYIVISSKKSAQGIKDIKKEVVSKVEKLGDGGEFSGKQAFDFFKE